MTQEILRFLTLALAAVFVGALVYSQYALLRVEIDRRKTLGWGWVGFRSPWSTRELTEHGLAYRSRSLRSLAVALAAFGLIAVVSAVTRWSAA